MTYLGRAAGPSLRRAREPSWFKFLISLGTPKTMSSLPNPMLNSGAPCPRAAELPAWGPLLAGLLAVVVAVDLTAGWNASSRVTLISWFLYASLGACWAIVIAWRELPVRDMLGARPSWADARLVVAATLACLGVRFGWFYVMDHMGWMPELPDEAPNAAYLFLTVALAPPVEEILFRGILLRRLAGSVGPVVSALLSSAIFAALHPDRAGSFLFSLVMVCLYVRTQSLWVPTLAHSLSNFVVPALDGSGLLMPMFSRGWVVAGAALVSLPWLAMFFRRGLRDLHRIPGLVEAGRPTPQRESTEQTESVTAAAPAPQPVVIADEPEVKAEPH